VIAALRVAGPGLALGETGIGEAIAQLRPAHAAAAAAVTAGLLALGALRGARAGAVAIAALATAIGAAAPAAAQARRPDVYVFLLDTLRADHLGEQADGGLPTPALARLAPEFVRFSSAWSPSTRTSRSMPGIMASLSVRVTGSPLAPEAVTLAERLQEGGWTTFGVSANPLVAEQFGMAQGFDSLSGLADTPDFLILSVLKLVSAALPAATYELGIASAELFYPPIGQLRRRALGLLDRSPGPTFVYAQTMDVHGPYLPPRRFLPPDYKSADFMSYYEFHRLAGNPALRSREMAPYVENVRQRYAGGVRHTDEELAAWIEDLRARGRWDEALVWILSDHGEAFGEHGFAGHGYAYVGSPVVKVPMWLKLPRSFGLEAREVTETVSTYDVLPTTLGLLGLPPVEPIFGVDLSPRLRGAPADPERTVVVETDDGRKGGLYSAVRDRFKLDVHFDSDGTSERRGLFDLAGDPGETHDVAARHPEVADALEAAIRERRSLERNLALARRERKIDAQTRERLRALGYLDE
jgi:arylsulfatase